VEKGPQSHGNSLQYKARSGRSTAKERARKRNRLRAQSKIAAKRMTVPRVPPMGATYAEWRTYLVDECHRWLNTNSLPAGHRVFLANFIEMNLEVWSYGRAQSLVSA